MSIVSLPLFIDYISDGVVSYSMRQGDRRGSDVEFLDFTYDGDVTDGQLSGGLGQLVDGDEGVPNFRLDAQNVGRRGYEWVAWKTDRVRPADADPVEIGHDPFKLYKRLNTSIRFSFLPKD